MAHQVETDKKVNLRQEVFIAYSNMERKYNSHFFAAELCTALKKKGIKFESYELAAVLTELVREKRFVLYLVNSKLCLQVSS